MFDWLGISPIATQVLGWFMIACGVVIMAILIWLVVVNGKNWIGFERNIKNIGAYEQQIEYMKYIRNQNSNAAKDLDSKK